MYLCVVQIRSLCQRSGFVLVGPGTMTSGQIFPINSACFLTLDSDHCLRQLDSNDWLNMLQIVGHFVSIV